MLLCSWGVIVVSCFSGSASVGKHRPHLRMVNSLRFPPHMSSFSITTQSKWKDVIINGVFLLVFNCFFYNFLNIFSLPVRQSDWPKEWSTGLAEHSTVCLVASPVDDWEHGCLYFTGQLIPFARLPTHHLSHYRVFFLFFKIFSK